MGYYDRSSRCFRSRVDQSVLVSDQTVMGVWMFEIWNGWR